jgi:formylglycine-generating enzyme required for sulfatase activity
MKYGFSIAILILGWVILAQANSAETPNTALDAGQEAIPESKACPDDMVEVEGDYCSSIEQTCQKWLEPEMIRCEKFLPSKCIGRTTHKHFCIDKYEWPNRPGENPIVMKTWSEARIACRTVGKRLCDDSEWTLACEGEELFPYPYGYERNAEACNIDKSHIPVNEKALYDPQRQEAELTRLWQGEPSGTREACVSPYGVHDMTGNVDEWVVNESGKPFNSGLKGGYWGVVRTRCRPMTTSHDENFGYYQISWRCCVDPGLYVTAP